MNEIDIREIVESVVREVIHSVKQEELAPSSNNQVLIVADKFQSFEYYRKQLSSLNERNVHFDLYITNETNDGDTGFLFAQTNKGKVILADGNRTSTIDLAKTYELFIFPELDMNEITRIALGIKGSPISELVYSALLLKKNIFIGKDALGISQFERNELQVSDLPFPYRKQYKQHCKQLEELGISFVTTNEIAERVATKLRINQLHESTGEVETLEIKRDGHVFTEKLLSTSWLNKQKSIENNKIYVQKSVIISPLAKDVLKEKGITISYLDEG